MQAAVAGPAVRAEHGKLPFEAVHARVHVALPLEYAGVVDEVPRGEGVRAVEDDVVVRDEPARVLARERGLPRLHAHVGVERLEPHARRIHLGCAERARVMDHLPLQVVHRDTVVIEDPESPDARCGEIERGRRPESAEPDDQRRGGAESFLSVGPDVREDEVARIALQFVWRERHRENIREGASMAVAVDAPSFAGVVPEPPPPSHMTYEPSVEVRRTHVLSVAAPRCARPRAPRWPRRTVAPGRRVPARRARGRHSGSLR